MTEGEPPKTYPLYLEVGDVLDLYAEIFGCSAEEAADQLRDLAGLEGALAPPGAHAHYEGADLAMQGAVLATTSKSIGNVGTAHRPLRTIGCITGRVT